MSSLTKAKADGIAALEQAVINDTPAEVAKLYQKLGKGVFTAHILGIAGRFRGLDMVKVLVENGASFHQDMEAVRALFPQIFENELATYLPDFFILFLIKNIHITGDYIWKRYIEKLTDRKGNPLKPVCEEELIQVVEYLCDNAEKVCFRPGDFLYFAILTDDKNMTAALKGKGVTISDEKQKMLTEGGGGNAWFAYCSLIEHLRDENFIRVMSALISELGREQSTIDSLEASKDKKLHYTDWLCHVNHNRFFSPEYLGFFLDHFNQSKMNKKRLMQEMIFYENVACLEIVAQYGWLKLPRKRDEMIEYAAQNGKTESTAWLLDYKNRTADLAAEAEKAEKKLMRELNASPNSVAELRKIWSYKKREDGTLIITNYKGRNEKVIVPEKIGKSIVSAIEIGAFAGNAVCVGDYHSAGGLKHIQQHRRITSITLPRTIRQIRSYAFSQMWALKEINIPEGVSEISECAFWDCRSLKNITIPGTVRKIGKKAFFGCMELEKVCVCEGVLEIGEHAFNACDKLREIRMPKSVQRLLSDQSERLSAEVFPYNQKLFIYCPKGSKTETYCREKHFRIKNSDNEIV